MVIFHGEGLLPFMLKRAGSLAILVLNIVWLLFLVSANRSWAQNDQIKVKLIEISGNKRIETKAIRARIKTQVGDPFLPEAFREDLKAVYEMGYFQDIRIETEAEPDGMVVNFIVEERPFLVDIQYAGNQKIMIDRIKEQVTLRTQTFVDDLKIKNNAERIRRYYEQEGYYQTQVIPVLRSLGEDRRGLIYYIKEGMKTKIRKIEFQGRQAIPAKKLIEAMETRKYSPLTAWLTSSGYYKKEVLNLDTERIREVYLNDGYLEVQVGSPEVELQDNRIPVRVPFPIAHGDLDPSYEFREVSAIIRIPLIEGEQFRVRKIEITGNNVIETPVLLSKLELMGGDLFRRNKLREGVAAIHDLYGEKGYLYANVVPQFFTHPEDRTVDLLLQISEDQQIRIRQIRIAGNDKTRDKVVRREIRLDEQDVISTRLLRRSFQRINNLNFFESIEVTPHRVSEDQVDLSVRVKEKSTGAMSIGGGYSSVDRFVGLAEITQGNLFGRGQLLRARGEFGTRRTTYSLTFREPYLFDKAVSGTVDAFNIQRDFDSYKERRVGGDLMLGKSFTEYVSGSVRYTREVLKIFDLSESAPDLIQDQVIAQGEKSVTSSIRATLVRDSRDFFFDPREGMRTAISVEHAGTFLGGNNDFIKTILDASRFYPLMWDTVFSLHGRFGYGTGIQGDDLPVGERFYVGGINTVRGFRFGTAGPVSKEGEIVGGDRELIFNAEYLIPLVPEARIKGVFFFDAGRAFDEDVDGVSMGISELRYSAGFGMRWISPIGPLRLEWGYNLDREPGEEGSQLDFSIGTLF